MHERDLEARLRSTYRAEAERADPTALAERVHSIPATAEPERRRWWHAIGFGVARQTGPRGEQLIGGINMLVSMRTAAVVAVMVLATSLVAMQVGSLDQSVTPGAAEPAGNWVTVTGTQEVRALASGEGFGTNTMSDPRVEGDVALTFHAEAEPFNSVNNYALWGTTTITNDGGAWHGRWIGFKDDQGLHHNTAWFEGTGDYEGLRYIEQMVEREPDEAMDTAGMVVDTTGLIYEGVTAQTVLPPVIPPEVAE